MNINFRLRNLFYFSFGVVLLIFLYSVRAVLIPFIVALIFAYIFNPLITFFNVKFKIPRTISIIVVYVLLLISIILFALFLTRTVIGESVSIANTFSEFFHTLQHDSRLLPSWMQPFVQDYSDYLAHNQFNVISLSPFPLFTRALSGVLSIFVMFFGAFFFLKDQNKLMRQVNHFIPYEFRSDVQILFKRVNAVLASYLRGQIILILSMVLMLFACLSILGIKYALTISVVSALFEIVPVMGPIFAGILGTFIILISGGSQIFDLNMYQTIGIVVAIYYVTRQLQDYIISPYVMSRATQLHPLTILFSVLAGQHLYGIVGVILAVPVVATLKIVYEFVLERVKEEDIRKGKSVKAEG